MEDELLNIVRSKHFKRDFGLLAGARRGPNVVIIADFSYFRRCRDPFPHIQQSLVGFHTQKSTAIFFLSSSMLFKMSLKRLVIPFPFLLFTYADQ